jgi:hypothetical protein
LLNFLFSFAGFLQLAIAIVGTRHYARRRSWYTLLVLAVIYGLAYDNFVIGGGALMGEGDLLQALNWPRYAIHALFTPTMMIAAFGALRGAGVPWAQGRAAHTVVCTLATALILLGSYVDIVNVHLVPQTANGVLRYVNDFEFIKGPPIPAVVTIMAVLVFGGFLWRQIKWPWLFVGALLMFLGAGAMRIPLAQNLGEIAFAAGLVSTMIKTHASRTTQYDIRNA